MDRNDRRHGAPLDDPRRIRAALAASAEIEPPSRTDAVVRRLLTELPLPSPFALRPGLAAGLAVAALFALVVGVAGAMAQAGAADAGPLLAVVAVGIYLALSAAATLPILLQARARRDAERLEVWP